MNDVILCLYVNICVYVSTNYVIVFVCILAIFLVRGRSGRRFWVEINCSILFYESISILCWVLVFMFW